MTINGKEIIIPIKPLISFFKVFESLNKMVNDNDKTFASYARSLIDELAAYPELTDGFEDPKLLDEYKEPIHKILRLLFPDALLINEIKAISGPFDFEPFYMTTRFKKILENAGEEFIFDLAGLDENLLYQLGCTIVLNYHFKFPIDFGKNYKFKIPDLKTGIMHSYRMAYNADLMEVIPTKNAKEISYEEYLELLDNQDNIALWKEKFPPDSWIIKGIGVLNFLDVTLEDSITDITSNLLLKSFDVFDNIKSTIRNIFNNNKLEVGFITYDKGNLIPPAAYFGKTALKSIILKSKILETGDQKLNDDLYELLINKQKAYVISDVKEYIRNNTGYLSKKLSKQNLKSYLISPLVFKEELYAFLEIGSDKKYQLNSFSLLKLELILPLLAMSASRFKIDQQNLSEAVIQDECTNIHPAVKWRFEDEAIKYIREKQSGHNPDFKDIVFKEVYPLYGQIDIKNSSMIRNNAAQADLIKQVEGVEAILDKALEITKMTIYEELVNRLKTFKNKIAAFPNSNTEVKALEFIRNEIYPFFKYLKNEHKEITALVDSYEKMLDPEFKIVYDKRKRYDDSVQFLNYELAAFLDDKQEEAQKLYPHYFERYKTDGVEYNIYIGDSISHNKAFNPIVLQNLRLWQLVTMCEMEQEFFNMKKSLSTHLEVASLILVYNNPMAIQFRMDEKRFDVEGAYNAKYEILKKRVDKSYIKGSKERITAPGKITIVYSNDDIETEYKMYIRHLEQKKYIKANAVEFIDIEDLQGISGLKAMRLQMIYKEDKDEIIKDNEDIPILQNKISSK